MHTRFRDRRAAGRQLAERLETYRERPATVVLGLPRGGVVVAAEIAAALRLPLDVVIARKIPAPGNPELAVGAVAEGGEPWLDERSMALAAVTWDHLVREVDRQHEEIARRARLYRRGRTLTLPPRATVIVVDDGVATGATVVAALRAVRQRAPARLVLAVPVAPPEAPDLLRPLVDELVVLATPEEFPAVGTFYDDFRQVSDDDVCRLLGHGPAARRHPGAHPPATAR
jgi:putative phosphoribosyl transferase